MNPANTKIANVVLLLCRKYTQDNCVAVSRYSFLPLPACLQQMFSNFSVTRLYFLTRWRQCQLDSKYSATDNYTTHNSTNNSSLTTTHSARNLGFIFDEHLTFSDQISSVSKSCYYHIRPYLDTKTASTIATSIVHSKLDYCNSLYHNLPKSQITRLQQIQNSLARAVVKAPKFSHTTPILRSLHWLKITERIEYKLLSLTYKVLTIWIIWNPTFISA